ncbi:RNA polymerase II C-terminal domain phosphatase-like 4 [Mercurialis annua]|uniref:RNA polymerase II C-terminal domain phosphatase-like 4 n=1 Tax=Mercurialis annua TaxID=3986 RepID=UPI00215EA9E4|nr:RNA polymerase II C-terminal domain phosphatase-like 4 [Mercurialis annua]
MTSSDLTSVATIPTTESLSLPITSLSHIELQNKQLRLHIELHELKRNDMTITQYLLEAKSLADQLAAAGRTISPAEFNAIMYRNICSEFHPIFSALNGRHTPLTFHELQGQLTDPLANVDVRSQSSPPIDYFCSHPAILKGMCTICGQGLLDGHGLFFGYIMNDLRLSKTEADRLRPIETNNILSKKKLLLVLDLDETLLHSRLYPKASPPQEEEIYNLENQKDVVKVELENRLVFTKLRPYVLEFLEEANTMFEMYVYTNASREYARKMMELLDPENRYFNSRMISREDSTESGLKNLDVVLGQERAIVILDDLEYVWPKHNANLIEVKKYKYFGQNQVNREIDENPDWMRKYLKILKKIHSKFFDSASVDSSSRDVRQVMRMMRRTILKGCKIVLHASLPNKLFLAQKAKKMGAKCVWKLDSSVTHVVTNKVGQKEIRWAKQKVENNLVSPQWIIACYAVWGKFPAYSRGGSRGKGARPSPSTGKSTPKVLPRVSNSVKMEIKKEPSFEVFEI